MPGLGGIVWNLQSIMQHAGEGEGGERRQEVKLRILVMASLVIFGLLWPE